MSEKMISHKIEADFYPIEFQYTAADNFSQRVFDSFALCYVTEGSLTYTVNKSRYDINPKDLFVIFPETIASIETDDKCIYFRLECNGTRAKDILARASLTVDNPVMNKTPTDIGEMFAGMLNMTGLTNAAADLTAQARVYGLLAAMIDSVTRTGLSFIEKDKQMASAVSYINENYMKSDLSVIDVASYVGLNANYLSRKFKEYTKNSFSKYLIEVRLRHACTMIAEGIHSIKTVSELTGYSNQLYFSKEFKKEVGCTPKEYRSRFK